jgi:hypothetical protein
METRYALCVVITILLKGQNVVLVQLMHSDSKENRMLSTTKVANVLYVGTVDVIPALHFTMLTLKRRISI